MRTQNWTTPNMFGSSYITCSWWIHESHNGTRTKWIGGVHSTKFSREGCRKTGYRGRNCGKSTSGAPWQHTRYQSRDLAKMEECKSPKGEQNCKFHQFFPFIHKLSKQPMSVLRKNLWRYYSKGCLFILWKHHQFPHSTSNANLQVILNNTSTEECYMCVIFKLRYATPAAGFFIYTTLDDTHRMPQDAVTNVEAYIAL